ncbi:hypothetical protein A2853_03015 [Candidatus Kaiserbacteria bacterium RIFCSPHIGHO2_01_FULL_55_17]|uniref:Peptidoglycan binding-like domain-containing protein n=1 Tax=Candidatus Kaiserbacteria bacterium RIFCSPHIGHO2_01_FULL_55_17 TaxID=1798484 RepID=A0A1F6D8X2_9BACT|nr:MAG: hypothetical protein A2853_03015 [Candidatus Kaiserbacteria bacterium RIFCSPHIGHO2_01_FULL_55_17]
MTKKFFLASASVSVAALLLPLAASAATNFNDVTFTANSSNLTVGGMTVSIAGSGAILASTTVDTSTFTILMGPASSISMSAPSLSVDAAASWITQDSCSGGQQLIIVSAPGDAATTSVIVTPSSSFCSAGGGSGGSSGGSAGGGGGGGTTTTTTTTTTATTTTTVAAVSTPTPTVTTGEQTTIAALIAQLQSLIALYMSLGGTVSPEMAALAGGSATPGSFIRDLKVGMIGADVMALQKWLNTHGYQVVASGPGSPGNETSMFGGATRAALIKFQKAQGISPAAGYFGPKTRAVVNGM